MKYYRLYLYNRIKLCLKEKSGNILLHRYFARKDVTHLFIKRLKRYNHANLSKRR